MGGWGQRGCARLLVAREGGTGRRSLAAPGAGGAEQSPHGPGEPVSGYRAGLRPGQRGEQGTRCGLLARQPLSDALQQKPCLRTPQQKGHCRGRGGGTMDAQDAKMLLQGL